MRRLLVALVALVAVSGLIAQSVTTEWQIEKAASSLGNDLAGVFEGHGGGQGGVARWTIPGKSPEEVWKVTMQSLMTMKGVTVDGRIEAGTIVAKKPGSLIRFVITKNDAGTNLVGKWEFVPGEKAQFSTPFAQAKKFFNTLFPVVKAALK